MNYSLNSLKGGCTGDYLGDCYRVSIRGILGVTTMDHMVVSVKEWTAIQGDGSK